MHVYMSSLLIDLPKVQYLPVHNSLYFVLFTGPQAAICPLLELYAVLFMLQVFQ